MFLHEINRWIFNFLISNYGRGGEGEERESQPVNIEVIEKAREENLFYKLTEKIHKYKLGQKMLNDKLLGHW